MKNDHISYIGIGSNLGDRFGHIRRATNLLRNCSNVKSLKMAPIYETEPVDCPDSNLFLNSVIELHYNQSELDLFEDLKKIESLFFREKHRKNGLREIDLDILTFDDLVVDSEFLVIPHPRMHLREFVLNPFSKINKNWIHPILNQSVNELLMNAQEQEKTYEPFLPS